MYLRKYPVKPRKLCTCFIVVGSGKFRTASVFVGDGLIVPLSTIVGKLFEFSFEHEFKIDDENYSLTWHVVPADKLKFEAVIGSDLLEQASISFTKEGVKLNKYENHAQLMQISAENLQEELDLRHVENRQIKNELEKLIQDYKPEKTASTDVTMRIILKDEEPVCQPLVD
ncbi:RVP domain-containing protein [Trichonephila clavipes]|nr:RVP domain-containing protein [Trichonephila clavipes]